MLCCRKLTFNLALSVDQFKATANALSLRYGAPRGHEDYSVINPNSFESDADIIKLNSQQRVLLNDAIENALAEYSTRLKIGRYALGFVVGAKYTYKETFRILGWDKNPNPQNVGGYFYNRSTNDCAIFINYNKEDDIVESTQYNDFFVNRSRFHWTTKNNRTIQSPEVQALLNQDTNQLRVPLFIRKEAKSEGSARYYIGELKMIKGSERPTMIGGKKAVTIEFELDEPVPQKLYQHLISS